MTTELTPIPSTPDLSPSSASSDGWLQQLGAGVLAAARLVPYYAEAPQEATLAALLYLLLRAEIDAGRLTLRARERLLVPELGSVEVDLLLHQPEEDACMLVEIDGHRWHRRTSEEHDRETRRDRLLRRHHPLLRYSAREVEHDPWRIALEIIDDLGAREHPFRSITLPAGLRALAEACKRPTGAVAVRPTHRGRDRLLSPLQQIRDYVAHLGYPEVDLREGADAPARHYESWAAEEPDLVLRAFHAHLDVEEIARALQRSVHAVWAQLDRMGAINR